MATITLKDLMRSLSRRCNDYVSGTCTGTSTALTLVDSRLGATFKADDYFNSGTLVLNEGTGSMVFSTDCEAEPIGDFTSVIVTDNDCKVTRDKTYKKSGKWCYKFVTGSDASDQAYASATLGTTYTTLYAQAQFYATANYTGASYPLQVQTAAGGAIVSVRLTNGVLAVYDHTGAAALTPTTTTFSTGTWHRIELGVVISATVGQIDLWLDEEHIYSGRAMNTGSSALQKVAVGLLGTTVAEAKTIYVDDVRADGAYIGTRTSETEKTITDYAYSTGTLTWAGNLVTPTANSTRYSIYDWPLTKWSKEQKKQAIRHAMMTLWPAWFVEKTDPATDSGTATITIAANTYQYACPSDCERILEVYLQPTSTSSPYTTISAVNSYVHNGQKYIYLPNAGSYTAGRAVRIVYLARQDVLENDNDELLIDASYQGWAQEYIMTAALAELWTSVQSMTDETQPMYRMFKEQAEMIKTKHPMPRPMSKVFTGGATSELSFTDRIDPTFSSG